MEKALAFLREPNCTLWTHTFKGSEYILMTVYYGAVFCVNVRGFLPRLATLLMPSKIMCLCTHIVLIFPYHDAKEEIWRYHFCQSFIIFIGYHCPAFVNKDIQCLEISVEPSPCIQFLHSPCDGQHNVQFEEIIWGVTWQSQWNFFNPLSPKLLMLQSTFIKSIKSLCHEQFNWGSSGQFFTMVMMQSKLSTCNLQHFKVVSTPED